MSGAYAVSNPVTSARGEIKLAKSADDRDQVIASLADRVGEIEQSLTKLGQRARMLLESQAQEKAFSNVREVFKYTYGENGKLRKPPAWLDEVPLPDKPPEGPSE